MKLNEEIVSHRGRGSVQTAERPLFATENNYIGLKCSPAQTASKVNNRCFFYTQQRGNRTYERALGRTIRRLHSESWVFKRSAREPPDNSQRKNRPLFIKLLSEHKTDC